MSEFSHEQIEHGNGVVSVNTSVPGGAKTSSGRINTAGMSASDANNLIKAAMDANEQRLTKGTEVSQRSPSTPTTAPAPVSEPPDAAGPEIVVTGQRQRKEDRRVRLKPFPNARQTVLGDDSPENILSPLIVTNGLVFPYTPTIQFSQDVDWKNADLTHTNYDVASYARTPAVTMSVTGKFTVQTHAEGRYLLAALHFLRVVSKMYFGKAHAQTDMAGVPPPVLLFSGYGPYMFNSVRVVVKNHSYTIDDTVNLVSVNTGTGDVIELPSLLTLSMTLQVVQTPRAQKDDFNLDLFRTGALMKGGGWL